MQTLPKLSPAQSLLLHGGARANVLTALLQRGWIEPADGGHLLTNAGYAAIGQQRLVPMDEAQPMDAADDLQLLEGIPVRPSTKLAALLVALRRPQGATSLQLMLATGWQPHTVRGIFAGAFKKKPGLVLSSSKDGHGQRVYRMA
ncbi:MAG: DUF3489 domain-containing protein [Burkholderiales bacterium]|nr:DUF3489 domain-containing protein [Burkholderiales bacterium]